MVLTIMGRFLKRQVYAELFAKELPGTRIAHCNQLHDKDLFIGQSCKNVFSSEHKLKVLNGAKSICEASLRHIKKFPLENMILQCCKSCILTHEFLIQVMVRLSDLITTGVKINKRWYGPHKIPNHTFHS